MTKKINTQEIIQIEKDFVLATYPRLPFVLSHGKGSYLYDTEGNRYLDFGSGIAVSAFGHCDEAIVYAVQEQVAILSHVSNLYHSTPQAELAEKLCENSFADKVFFCNSGAEAVEASLKFARKYALTNFGSEKNEIVAFTNGFHGRTFGALSVTAREKYQAPFRPLLSQIKVAEFNNIGSTQAVINQNTCAVIVEIVQGEGGVNTATKEFLMAVRKLCTKYNALMIVDEIQTGFGRTGTLWAHEQFGITPDLMTLAKALGGGLPIGATLMSDEVASCITAGDHGSTFGGGPVVARAALSVMNHFDHNDVLKHVNEISDYLISSIENLKLPQIAEIRGLGLMIGIELNVDASSLYKKAHEYGILLLTAGPNVIRLLPPLNISKIEVDEFINALKKMIVDVLK